MDTQPALLMNCLLHSNSQLEETDPTQAVEAEGDRRGRGGGCHRRCAVSTPVIAQYQVRYSFRGYDFDAVEFSSRPTPAFLMDAEQPVATTTDGHAAGIFDRLPSAQQLSAGGAGSNTGSGGRGRPRGCRGRGGGCPRQGAASTPVSFVQGLGVTGRVSMQTSEVPPQTVEEVMILDNTIATAFANAETGLHPIAQYILRYSFRGT